MSRMRERVVRGGEPIFLDVRQAARLLMARPFFTLAVLAILAVGIGVNAAAFSLARGLLFRPLPYPEPGRIVAVGQVSAEFPGAAPRLSSSDLLRLWDEARSFDQLAALASSTFRLDGPSGPTGLPGARVSPSFFPLLRAEPQLGRLLVPSDAVEGAQRMVLLNHGVWTNVLASDPDIVGEVVAVDGDPHVVAGVLRDGFEFEGTELWVPFVVAPDESPEAGGAVHMSGFTGLGRLRQGVSPEQAEAEVRAILDRARPERPEPLNAVWQSRVTPLQEAFGAPFRPAFRMFTAATGLVLLLACANVAGLLLARGKARRRELAVRSALGAGQGRLVRQLLTESVVLSVVGGSVGLALAAGIVRAVPALVPVVVPGLAEVRVDGLVVAFGVGLSIVVGLLSGAAPALGWVRGDRGGAVRMLNDAGAPSGSSVGRLRSSSGQTGLAVVQVALAVALLTAAGLFLRSLVAFVTFDLGFDPNHVMVARADMIGGTGEGRVFDAEEVAALNVRVRRSTEALLMRIERIANLPDVRAVALTTRPPLFGGSRRIGVVGRPASSDPRDDVRADVRSVSPGYADLIGLPLLSGRFFTARDAAGSPRVAVVSESFAREVFGGEPAIGQRLTGPAFPFPGGGTGETWEIVGVVGDVNAPPDPGSSLPSTAAGDVYLSVLQPGMDSSWETTPFVTVRTASDPFAVVPFLREVLDEVYPGALVTTSALDARLSARFARLRFYVVSAGVFGAVALLLAAFGLYGVLSYMVSQRRREIGVRVALGAGNRAVLTLVLGQGGLLVGAGVVIGLLVSAAANRVIESVLFGVRPVDPLTSAAVTMVVFGVGLLACWSPARRAARIDPMDVLREA